VNHRVGVLKVAALAPQLITYQDPKTPRLESTCRRLKLNLGPVGMELTDASLSKSLTKMLCEFFYDSGFLHKDENGRFMLLC